MATKRAAKKTDENPVAEEVKPEPKVRHVTFSVQAGFPAEEEDGWAYRNIGEAATFNIARDVAFSLAKRGLRVRYPRPENERNEKFGWYVATHEKADQLAPSTWERYATESIVDRAQIAASEMKVRSRLGNILGELRGISEETRAPAARRSIRNSMLEISKAAFAPVNASNIGAVGFSTEPDITDIIAEAIGAQGIEFDGACVGCGENHEPVAEYTILQLIQMADDSFRADADPVADAMIGVEGMQA